MNGNILNRLRKSLATIVTTITLSCMATNAYAGIPIDISQYSDEGISKDYTDDYNIDIPVKYLAYESGSYTSSSYCVVFLESPSGTSYNITGNVGNPGFDDYTHYEYTEADEYVYIDLQQKEAGEWRLKLVQANAGNWYYTTNESDTPNPYTTQTIDGKIYLLNTQTKEAKIQKGEYNIAGEFIIPETVTYEGNDYTVTAIGRDCFAWTHAFSSIVIPNTIKEIGESAFDNCESVKSITIPEGVTKIPKRCFCDCDHLETVYLPSTITHLGNEAFEYSHKLTSLTIPESVTTIGDACFSSNGLEALTIPANVTSLGDYCFNNENLKRLRMLSSIPPACIGSLGLPSYATIYVDDVDTYKATVPWSNYNIENPEGFPIAEVEVDGLKYRIYNNGTADLIANNYNEGDLIIPNTFTHEGITYTPTSIVAYCFKDCYPITSIAIPQTIKEFGNNAFEGCSSLKTLAIPEGVTKIPKYSFARCGSLTNISLPSTITELGICAFELCGSLKSLTIPESVTSLGDACFRWTGFEMLDIPANVTSIGNSCFDSGDLRILRMMPTTPPTCLGGLGLSSDAIIYVENNAIDAYKGTEPWNNYEIKSTDEYPIGDIIVDGLKYRIYPNKEAELLSNNYDIEGDFIIPSEFTYSNETYNVTGIGMRCFSNCDNITNITLPETITKLGDNAFEGCSALTSITIPNGITKIPRSCFGGCRKLANISLPSSIKELGDYAFEYCDNLRSLNIPESVTILGSGCFQWNGINMLTIPENVATIGHNCFCNRKLMKLIMLPVTPPTCDGDLGLSSNATIYVDDSAINNYKGNEPWGNYNIENTDGLPITEMIVNECKYWIYNSGKAELVSNVNDLSRDLIVPEAIEHEGTNYTVVELIDECLRNCNPRSIVLPSTINKIGNNCFHWDLLNLVIMSETPPSCNEDALGDLNYVTIYTDKAYIPDYQISSEWAGYTYKPKEEFFLERMPVDDFTYNIYMFNGYAEVAGYNNTEGTDYEIPKNITFNGAEYVVNKICSSSLSWNVKITSIIIPESITLTDESFISCDKLRTILCLASTPPSCTYGLNFNSNATIYVNKNVVDTYKNAEHWGKYAIESLDHFSITSSAKNGELKYRLYTYSNKASLMNNNYRFTGKVELPQTVTHENETYTLTALDDNCFYTCSGITEIVLPNTVNSLGKSALEFCSAMTEFTLPENVTSIGQNCLKGCNKLIGLKCMAKTPPVINTALGLKLSVPVYVPTASMEAYKAADVWKNYDIRSIDNYDAAINAPTIDGLEGDVKVYDLNGFRLGNAKGKGIRILHSKGKSKKVVY